MLRKRGILLGEEFFIETAYWLNPYPKKVCHQLRRCKELSVVSLKMYSYTNTLVQYHSSTVKHQIFLWTKSHNRSCIEGIPIIRKTFIPFSRTTQ